MHLHPPGAGRIKLPLLLLLAALSLGPVALAELASAAAEPGAAARTLRYWTPQRMASARPLELVLDGEGEPSLRFGRPAPRAGASFLAVPTPEVPPYSFNGRIFIRVGDKRGYCSGTAIDSPSRQLVLTAGHCVNAGSEYRGNLWYRKALFVPAYTAGEAPFGAFPAKPGRVFSAPQWTNGSNSDFDVGAFLTYPNNRGIDLADAVGGGATIALDLPRAQRFASFGYPGNVARMQACNSPYAGDDRFSFPLPGPPTMSIDCHWAPGASGGGWLIEDGTRINGLNAYLHVDDPSRTYSPYFSSETVGKLVAGL
jgi:hypothetical protein